MSEKSERICLGCMRYISIEEETCHFCGFNSDDYQVNPRCLPLGTKLADKYIVGKVIGEGGFGVTYLGWDMRPGIRVAIKEFFPPKVASRDTTNGNNTIYVFEDKDKRSFEDGMKRCVKEVQSMSRLESLDGSVTIRDFFHENNTAYIIMDYVDGITLKEYLETNGKMPPKDVIDIMKPIMEALAQMHQEGIIHRDISPDNIMIRKDGKLKLIDFGSARVVQEDDGKSLTIMLKMGFSPEEQYRTKGNQGPWTDVYALCATIYHMMTGKIPPEAMERLVEDTYQSIGSEEGIDLPSNIVYAIDKGLSVRSKDRYQSVTELIEAIYGEQKPHIILSENSGKNAAIENSGVSRVGETVLVPGETILDEDGEFALEQSDLSINYAVDEKSFFAGKRKWILAVGALIFAVLAGGGILLSQRSSKPDRPIVQADVQGIVSNTAVESMTEQGQEKTEEPIGEQSQEVTEESAVESEQEKTEEPTTEPEQEVTIAPTSVPDVGSTVPDVVGETKQQAIKKIKKAGLKYKITNSYSSDIEKGYVVTQSKKAGHLVKTNTVVKLVVSKGPKATPTPKPKATSTPKPKVTPTPKPTATPKAKATTKPKTTKKPKSSKKSKKKNNSNISAFDDEDMVDIK